MHVSHPFQRPHGAIGMNGDPGHVGEVRPVSLVDGQPAVDHLRQAGDLGPADRRQQVAQAVVEPHLDVLEVGGRLPGLGRQVADTVGDGGVRRHDHPPAARRGDLVAVEREHADVAERPGRTLPVGGSERLGGVLHQRDAVLAAQRGDRVVVGALAVEVDHDGGGRQPSAVAGGRQRLGEQRRVHVPTRPLAVDEHRVGAAVDDGVGAGGEREARHEHVVAGPHAAHQQGEVQGGGATRQRDGTGPAGEGGDVALEAVELRSGGCHPSALERAQEVLALERSDVRRAEVDARHQSRSTCSPRMRLRASKT